MQFYHTSLQSSIQFLELVTGCTVRVAYFKSLLAVLAALMPGVHYKCIAVINNEPQFLPMDIKPQMTWKISFKDSLHENQLIFHLIY